MSYKDKYLNRHEMYQTNSLRDSYIHNTQSRIDASFADNPSTEQVLINDSETETGVWIVEDTKNPYLKKIIMHPDSLIESGWTIYWDDNYWLVLSADNTKDVNSSGFIAKCNTTIKWLDDSGEIRSYPCLFEHGSRAFLGSYTDKVMTTPDGRRWITIQKNEHTSKLSLDDRFIFDKSAYKVIDFDSISREGLIELSLIGDQINTATDNLELGIADYYKKTPDEKTEPLDEGYSLVIKSTSNTPNEIKINQQKEYYIEVYQDSILVEGQDVVWTLYAEDKINNTNLAEISNQSSTGCIVKNKGATSGSIQLKAELTNNSDVFSWIQIKMKSLF